MILMHVRPTFHYPVVFPALRNFDLSCLGLRARKELPLKQCSLKAEGTDQCGMC